MDIWVCRIGREDLKDFLGLVSRSHIPIFRSLNTDIQFMIVLGEEDYCTDSAAPRLTNIKCSRRLKVITNNDCAIDGCVWNIYFQKRIGKLTGDSKALRTGNYDDVTLWQIDFFYRSAYIFNFYILKPTSHYSFCDLTVIYNNLKYLYMLDLTSILHNPAFSAFRN